MFVLADPDAAVAYRSLAHVLRVGAESDVPNDVQPLVQAVLRSYVCALNEARTPGRRIAWATFVRYAMLLYFALDRQRDRYANARWQRAVFTLRQIARENADLIVGSAFEEAF